MRRVRRFSAWPAALLAGIGVAGCAQQTDYSQVSTSPVNMVCDDGKAFTVSYANGFETAIIESDGRRFELQKVRTTIGMTPTPGFTADATGPGFGTVETFPGVQPESNLPSVTTGGTTGVRYSGDDAYYLSRNQAAVLQIGDETFSNCQVARA
jgi:hypothetical protein